MDDINKINETGGAGDWGTDKARAKLQKDTPGQEITKGKKMKTFKDVLQNIDEAMSLSDIRKKKEREEKRKKSGETRSQRMNRKVYGNMMGRLKDDVQEEKNCGCGQDPCITYGKVDEAMSEKDKKKRLALIKKAVERINKQNADKAKKDALAMMKASGMFDEQLDEVSAPNSLEMALEIKVDLGVSFEKGPLRRTDAEELKREWDLYRLEIRKVVKPLGGLVIDQEAPSPKASSNNKRIGTMTIGTRGDTSKLDPRKIKAALSRNVEVTDMVITKLD